MSVAAIAQDGLAVMTYNIRYANAGDWENHWNIRKARLIQQVREEAPDIVGFQEALHEQVVDLESGLPGYDWVGVGRDDGHEAGEYAPIFVRTKRYKILRGGTFWLSSTPDSASIGWDAACKRICTFAVLSEKSSGKKMVVFNTHLDHEGKLARQLSAQLLMRKINELSRGQATILLGDFNFEPSDPLYRTFINAESQLADAFAAPAADSSQTNITFPGNGFAASGPNSGKRIDYIFYSVQLVCHSTTILRAEENGLYPSDHLPQLSRLRWR